MKSKRLTRDGNTPLHSAILGFCGDTTPIEILLQHDANDINVRNSEGQTPLHLAAQNQVCSVELVKLLLGHKADAQATSSRDGNTALHWLATSCKGDLVAIRAAQILLEKGSDVNAVNTKGETPLHLAVRNEFLCHDISLMAKLLRAHGADVGVKDAKGENAYQAFCQIMKKYHREVDLVARVLLLEADELREEHKITPLHVACLCHKLKSIHKLLKLGVEVNATDSFGNSPLHYAVISPGDVDESTLELMFEYGGIIKAGFKVLCATSTIAGYSTFVDMISKSSYKIVLGVFNRYLARKLLLTQYATREQNDIDVTKQKMIQKFREFLSQSTSILDNCVKEYKDWLNRCSEELKTMSDTRIGESKVTFLNFLLADAKKTWIYAKNTELVKAFNVQKAMFPIYEVVLDAKIDRDLERLKLIEEAGVVLSDILEFGDPSDEFFRRTLSYCSNQDLMRIIGEKEEV